MGDVFHFEEPKRGKPPVLCEVCGEELEAYGVEIVSLVIAGSRPYLWRHVSNHLETCTRTYPARPYDDFAAHRQIERAESTQEEPPCTCTTTATSRTLDRACPVHGDAAEAARRAVARESTKEERSDGE